MITHLPILMYHQIMPKSHPDFQKHIAVTPENFREQISILQDRGWKIKTLEEYFTAPLGKGESKVAILTFDDVCKNFPEYAAPIMKDLGVRGNIYPIQNMTYGKKFYNLKPEGIPALSEEDIIELDKDGFEIGSHAQSHQNLHKIPFEEARKEIIESKLWLEGLLKKDIQSICYPIGGVDRDIIETAAIAGYKIGITTLKGSLQLSGDQMKLRRVDIKNHIIGKKFIQAIGPFYGMRRFLTRPFRPKYQVSHRHPSFLK